MSQFFSKIDESNKSALKVRIVLTLIFNNSVAFIVIKLY